MMNKNGWKPLGFWIFVAFASVILASAPIVAACWAIWYFFGDYISRLVG